MTETRTVEVEVERIVPVDERLTRPIDPPDVDVETCRDAAIIGVHYKQKWESCETQKEEIRGLTDGLD